MHSDFYEVDTVKGLPLLININNITTVHPKQLGEIDYDMTKTVIYLDSGIKYEIERNYNDVVRILKLKSRR